MRQKEITASLNLKKIKLPKDLLTVIKPLVVVSSLPLLPKKRQLLMARDQSHAWVLSTVLVITDNSYKRVVKLKL